MPLSLLWDFVFALCLYAGEFVLIILFLGRGVLPNDKFFLTMSHRTSVFGLRLLASTLNEVGAAKPIGVGTVSELAGVHFFEIPTQRYRGPEARAEELIVELDASIAMKGFALRPGLGAS